MEPIRSLRSCDIKAKVREDSLSPQCPKLSRNVSEAFPSWRGRQKKRQKDEGRTEERLVWVPSLIPTNVGLTTTSCGSTYMSRRSQACPRHDLNLNENTRYCRRLPPDQVAVRETLPSSGLGGVSKVFSQQGNSNYHPLPVFITAAGWALAPFDEGLLRKSRRLKLKSKQLHKGCFLLFIPSLRKKKGNLKNVIKK